MLGSIGSSSSWQWAAWGKHPAAKDFFSIGAKDPLVQAFSDWVEKGYQILNSKGLPSSNLCSWRFWARGPKKESLICGIGKDSSDSVGRPYPLLIMGTGPLAGWGDEWDLLPFACEKTWSQMEYLSAKRFADFRHFEGEVKIIRQPYPEWSEFRSEKEGLEEGDRRDLESRALSLLHETDLFVLLAEGTTHNSHSQTCLWHSLLKARNRDVPNAVFVGGGSKGTYLAVFMRALAPADFVRLWSGGKELEVGGEDAGGDVGGHRLDV